MFSRVACSAVRAGVRAQTLPSLRLYASAAPKPPAGLLYTADHEWIKVENGVGTVGITHYAQSQLGDVVFVDIPAVGQKRARKEPLAAVESVKAASDVYAPVSGEVVESNGALSEKPSLINNSPYTEGWIAKIKISNPKELEGLLDEAAYSKHTSH